MIHSYKNLVCAALVGASFVACCFQPIHANAVDVSVGEQAGIYDYLNAGGENLGLIDFRLDDDSDGNRSVRLQIYGLQSAMISAQSQIYDNMDFSVAPSSVSVSGSSLTGLYKSALDNKIHSVTQSLGSSDFTSPVAWSDEFSLSFSVTNYSSGSMTSSFRSGSSERIDHDGHYYVSSAPYILSFPNSSYFTNPYSKSYSWGTDRTTGISLIISSSGSIPTLDRSLNWSNFVDKIIGEIIGANAVSVDLPPATVDTLTPWDYYNNTLLPYIQNEFPDLPDLPDLLIFPDGYQEPVQPTTIPIVYPTMPGFDFGLIEDGTEPEGIETAAFELPQIETKSIGIPVFDFDSLNPAEIVAPVSNGVSGIWALITDVLQSFGLFPLVTLSLLVAVIGAILLLGR